VGRRLAVESVYGKFDQGTRNYQANSPGLAKNEAENWAQLVDGNELADKLKDLGLGVGKEMIEIVTVDAAWFENV